MADTKKQPPKDPEKERLKKQIEGEINKVNDVSDVMSGRSPIKGKLAAKLKVKKDVNKKKRLVEFSELAEKDFNPVLKDKDKPYGGLLGKVDIDVISVEKD